MVYYCHYKLSWMVACVILIYTGSLLMVNATGSSLLLRRRVIDKNQTVALQETFEPFSCRQLDAFKSSKGNLRRLFAIAQEFVGLHENIDDVPLFKFFEQTHGISVHNISNTPMAYVRVYKGGNNMIRDNLRAHEGDHLQSFKSFMYGDVAMDEKSLYKWTHDIWHRKNVQMFTFVRNPLLHFASGLREYSLRCPGDLPKGHTTFGRNFVKTTIRAILTNTLSECGRGQLTHVFPMTGVLRPYMNIRLVGRLERFQDDWARVEQMYGLPVGSVPMNMSLGQHPDSSHDSHAINIAVDHLFASEPVYLQALCALLYYDFVCFNYSLPDVCADAKELNPTQWQKKPKPKEVNKGQVDSSHASTQHSMTVTTVHQMDTNASIVSDSDSVTVTATTTSTSVSDSDVNLNLDADIDAEPANVADNEIESDSKT